MEWIIIFGIIGGLILVIMGEISKQQKAKEVGAIERVFMAKYLIGLPGVNTSSKNVECVITEKDFIFFPHLEMNFTKRFYKPNFNSR